MGIAAMTRSLGRAGLAMAMAFAYTTKDGGPTVVSSSGLRLRVAGCGRHPSSERDAGAEFNQSFPSPAFRAQIPTVYVDPLLKQC